MFSLSFFKIVCVLCVCAMFVCAGVWVPEEASKGHWVS